MLTGAEKLLEGGYGNYKLGLKSIIYSKEINLFMKKKPKNIQLKDVEVMQDHEPISQKKRRTNNFTKETLPLVF